MIDASTATPAHCWSARPEAARLICLPHVGGRADGFRRWAGGLRGTAEVWGLDRPGRHDRADEPFPATVEEIVDDVVAAIEPLQDRPVHLFGHSMGGWIAFEAALALQRRGRAVAGVLVSSTPGPAILAERAPSRSVTEEDILDRCRSWGGIPEDLLADPEFRETAFPAIRADILATEDYRSHGEAQRLAAPLLGLAGRADRVVPGVQVAAWADRAEDWRGLTILPGGHFHTVTSEDRLLRVVRSFLMGAAAGHTGAVR